MVKDGYATTATLDALDKSNPALSNPAVARCCKAWKKAYRAELAEKDFEWSAADKAAEAFRGSMPTLTSREDCRDFIACVAQGMLVGAITEKNGGKLLYAAQIALSSVPSEETPRKTSRRPRKTPESQLGSEPDWTENP